MGAESEALLVSGSWSKKLALWDIRAPSAAFETELPGKAFAIDVDIPHQRVVVATSGRRNCFFDIRQGKANLVLDRESSLKFQTRCVKFFPEGTGIALGSVEGRVGIEFLDELGIAAPMKRYAFKCHRVNDNGTHSNKKITYTTPDVELDRWFLPAFPAIERQFIQLILLHSILGLSRLFVRGVVMELCTYGMG